MTSSSHEEIPYHQNSLRTKTETVHKTATTILNNHGVLNVDNEFVLDTVAWANSELWTSYRLSRVKDTFNPDTVINEIIKNVIQFDITERFPDGQQTITSYMFSTDNPGFSKQIVQQRREEQEKLEQMLPELPKIEKGNWVIISIQPTDGIGGAEYELELFIDILNHGLELLTK